MSVFDDNVSHMRRPTILVLDDEPMLLWLFVTALKKLDCNILESTSVDKALELCSDPELILDLVITDFQMPRLTGLQFAEVIWVQRPKLEIVFVTGNAEVHQTLSDRGFVCLSKPFGMEVLRDTVRKRLQYLTAT